MKCEFCHKEIIPGTEVIAEGHSFCNSLHRYYWENGMVYDGSKFTTTGESNSQPQMTNGENSKDNRSDGKMYDINKPMTLGDIFSTSFELIKNTFTRNIVIAAVFLIPAGILFAYGIESFFSTFSGFINHSSQNDLDIDRLSLIFKGIGIYFMALLVFWFCYQAAIIGITKIGCSAINGERISLKETFKKIFSVTYFQSLGQVLLIAMTVAAFALAVIIIVALINIGDFVMFRFVGVLLIIAGVVFLIYLIFRWYFVLIALINDELGVIDTFSKSSFLIKGYWWRTFGIIILISIAVNFAISLISTPVSFGLMWGHMSQYFKMIGGNEQAAKNPEFLSGFMKSYFSVISILIILSNFLELLITPLFKIAIYYDLKIRKNDIIEPSGDESGPLNPELSA